MPNPCQISLNYSAKSESRRPSRRSDADHSRSQSKSNRGSAARSSYVHSVNYGADDNDDDDYLSRGTILSFSMLKGPLFCYLEFIFLTQVFHFFNI